MDRDWWEKGRQAFPLIAEGPPDYAGQDISSVYLANADDLSHAFLNGVSVDQSAFVNSRLDHCELAESTLTNSHFVRVDLTASDFVRSTITQCQFESCNFTNGEWRESTFEDVSFKECNFSHTTINLSSFDKCRFSHELDTALDHRSVSYNTFAQCTFERPIADHLVASRNFGLPNVAGLSPPILAHSSTTLEQVCLASGSGAVVAKDLVSALRHEGVKPHNRLKKLRLEFISNIVSLLARNRRLSASSLIYVETIFAEMARRATNEADLMAVMTAIVNLRKALYDVAVKAPDASPPGAVTCEGVIFHFRETFSRSESQVLVNILSEIVFGRPGDVTLVDVRSGSTWIDCVFPVVASAASVVGALNLLLSQANTTVDRLSQLSTKLHKALRRQPQAATRPSSRRRYTQAKSKIPAILNPTAAFPDLALIRAAVERHGEILVRFDDHVEIKLILTQERSELGR